MTDKERERLELEEQERKLRAKLHRYMGTLAAVLGVVAAIVALARMETMFGVSPWEALGIGSTGMPWVILILGLGVLFSMGTSRIAIGIEWLVKRIRGEQGQQG